MKWLSSLWETIASWFSKYIWRSKTGKAGSGLVAIYVILDFHSRVEVFVEEIRALPTLLALMHAWWFNPTVLVVGLCLIVLSTKKAKAAAAPRARTVEERVGALESGYSKLAQALASVPYVIIRIGEYNDLMQEATESVEALRDIREFYPGSPVSLKPFSLAWRQQQQSEGSEPAGEDVKVGMRWIRLLDRHRRHVRDWGSLRGINLSSDLVRGLNAKPDLSWAEAENLLNDHIVRIKDLRDGYAAAVRDNVLAASAI
jgi:hypothetical protein